VYEGDVIWPQYFATHNLALPLTDKEIPKSFWSSFGTANGLGGGARMVEAMMYQGQHYAIPEFIDEGFLYYRKDLLARAGLKPPRTWEDLASDAQVLRRDDLPYKFVWQGDNYEGLTCDWYEFMADAFGGLPPGVGGPADTPASLAAALDSRQALKALDYLRSLILEGISPPNVDTFQETDADSAFDSGQAAFLRGWDSSYANATSSASSLTASQVGVELPPTFAGNPGHGWSTLGGWGLFINPYSKNRQAALTFAKWLAGPQAQRILATEFSQIPADESIRDDPQVQARNPVLRAAAGAWVLARPASTRGYLMTITKVISSNIHAALPSQRPYGEDACRALLQAARTLDPGVSGGLNCGDQHGR
jgi:multiple sugar transport system substrate-binding protein